LFLKGGRRSGKTSLIKKISKIAQKQKRFIPVYVNFQDKFALDAKKITIEIAKELKRTIRWKKKILMLDFDFGFFLSLCKRFLSKAENKGKLLFLFDEFDVVFQYPGNENPSGLHPFQAFFIDELLPLFRQENIKVIATCMLETQSIVSSENHPSAIDADCITLRCLNFNETEHFIKKKNKHLEFKPEAIDYFFDQTGGQVFFSQILAYTAFETALSENKTCVDLELIKKASKELFIRYQGSIYWIWDSFHPEYQKILLALSQCSKDKVEGSVQNILLRLNSEILAPNLEQQLDFLLVCNFLKKEADSYSFTTPLLGRWILFEKFKKQSLSLPTKN